MFHNHVFKCWKIWIKKQKPCAYLQLGHSQKSQCFDFFHISFQISFLFINILLFHRTGQTNFLTHYFHSFLYNNMSENLFWFKVKLPHTLLGYLFYLVKIFQCLKWGEVALDSILSPKKHTSTINEICVLSFKCLNPFFKIGIKLIYNKKKKKEKWKISNK